MNRTDDVRADGPQKHEPARSRGVEKGWIFLLMFVLACLVGIAWVIRQDLPEESGPSRSSPLSAVPAPAFFETERHYWIENGWRETPVGLEYVGPARLVTPIVATGWQGDGIMCRDIEVPASGVYRLSARMRATRPEDVSSEMWVRFEPMPWMRVWVDPDGALDRWQDELGVEADDGTTDRALLEQQVEGSTTLCWAGRTPGVLVDRIGLVPVGNDELPEYLRDDVPEAEALDADTGEAQMGDETSSATVPAATKPTTSRWAWAIAALVASGALGAWGAWVMRRPTRALLAPGTTALGDGYIVRARRLWLMSSYLRLDPDGGQSWTPDRWQASRMNSLVEAKAAVELRTSGPVAEVSTSLARATRSWFTEG